MHNSAPAADWPLQSVWQNEPNYLVLQGPRPPAANLDSEVPASRPAFDVVGKQHWRANGLPASLVHKSPMALELYSLEPELVSGTPTLMREKIVKTTFLGTAVIATGGWVWLLYVALKWIILEI
jgi:hypothetical protein